jgi:hypothetical protein
MIPGAMEASSPQPTPTASKKNIHSQITTEKPQKRGGNPNAAKNYFEIFKQVSKQPAVKSGKDSSGGGNRARQRATKRVELTADMNMEEKSDIRRSMDQSHKETLNHGNRSTVNGFDFKTLITDEDVNLAKETVVSEQE